MTSYDVNSDSQLRLDISGLPGAELAGERQRRGMTIEQVASELKLSRTTLQRLEADEMSHLPPAFVRGYISNYAQLLGLDPQPLIANLARPEASELRGVLPVPRSGQRVERVMRLATYLLVTTVIVPPLVYFFVERGVDWFEPKLTSASPQTAAEAPATATPVDLGQASVPPRRSETLAASTLPLSSLSSLPPGPTTGQGNTESPTTEVLPDPRTLLELELVADSWVEIEDASGERLEFDLLRAGQEREYRGMAPFELLIGRGNAVELTLDGEPVMFEGYDSDGVARFELQRHLEAQRRLDNQRRLEAQRHLDDSPPDAG